MRHLILIAVHHNASIALRLLVLEICSEHLCTLLNEEISALYLSNGKVHF